MDLKLLNVSEVADILGCSLSHTYELINSKAIPSVNVASPNAKARRLKVSIQDLEQFIKEGGVKDETY